MSWTPAEQIASIALGRIRRGELTLRARDGSERVFRGTEPGPQAVVELRSPAAARRTVAGNALGMAEAYMDGGWDTPDLDAVLDLGVANLGPEPRSHTNLLTPIARQLHRLRDNSVSGSKKNIAYHYDLGNDFYRLWLDETMTYSSALFPADDPRDTSSRTDASLPTADADPSVPTAWRSAAESPSAAHSLEAAQRRKWDHLLDLLQPGSKDHVLEIGCGWGGFALHAAREAGCKVTGVTLSEEQYGWATRAVEQEGLEGRVEIRLQDYRHIPESFTRIASIEMFEAVGEKWWPVFFGRLGELLAPGGAVALQTITIDDRRFDDYRRHPDFIQRYVFPGGMLPSPERFAASAGSAGLRMDDPVFFGQSYAATLRHWAERFEGSLDNVRALGFDERFVRMWRYYLSYCRAGFQAGTVDVMQVRLSR